MKITKELSQRLSVGANQDTWCRYAGNSFYALQVALPKFFCRGHVGEQWRFLCMSSGKCFWRCCCRQHVVDGAHHDWRHGWSQCHMWEWADNVIRVAAVSLTRPISHQCGGLNSGHGRKRRFFVWRSIRIWRRSSEWRRDMTTGLPNNGARY